MNKKRVVKLYKQLAAAVKQLASELEEYGVDLNLRYDYMVILLKLSSLGVDSQQLDNYTP